MKTLGTKKVSVPICLSLLATTGLSADDGCCPPCEPSCVPQPKKCINCECYTPQ